MLDKIFRFFCFALLVQVVFISCKPQKLASKSNNSETKISEAENFANQFIFSNQDLKSAHIGISIFNTATQSFLYNHQADKFFVPASNTKIPTCYLAMKYLGDSLVAFQYKKITNGSVQIKPTADPTFLHSEYNSNRQLSFLKQFNAIEIVRPNTSLKSYGSGWAWNDYEETYMAPRSIYPAYGNIAVFQKNENKINSIPSYLLESAQIKVNENSKGISVKKLWDSNQFLITDGKNIGVDIPFLTDEYEFKKILANETSLPISISTDTSTTQWSNFYSQPTDSMLSIMMHRSDNYLAEQSLLMAGLEKNGIISDALAIDNALKTDFAQMPHKPRWVDGSGLSRYNLFTPQDFVWLLNKIKTEFSWNRITNIFETGGEGTISSYYKNYVGKIYAKTGTLGNQVALSGYLISKNNTMFIFSVLVNNHQTTATNVRKAIESYLTAIIENY